MPSLISTNPAAAFSPVGEVPISTDTDIVRFALDARAALPAWKRLGVEGRVRVLRKVFEIYVAHEEELAALITKEVGKPISQSKFDLATDKEYFNWYLDNAEAILAPRTTYEDENELHTLSFEPLGVAAVISPWNFPTMLFVRQVIPLLIAGNTVLFKHSHECPLVGQFLNHIFQEAGMPTWVFSHIVGEWSSAGKLLLEQNIDCISFTGSTSTGAHIRNTASLKGIPAITELWWSAPGIVAPDADISTVVDAVWFYRYFNNGQICDWLKRLLVHTSRFDEVCDAITAMLQTKHIWDPLDEHTDFGSLVSAKQVSLLQEQLNDARMRGAHIQEIWNIPASCTWAFVLPSVITGVTSDMKIWHEEVFWPALPIVSYETLDEAIALANNTQFWLWAYLFTNDAEIIRRCSDELETNMLSINWTNYCRPRNPFGGRKYSGLGSEHGPRWLYELVHSKVVTTTKKSQKT